MRLMVVVLALAACGGSTSHPVAHVERPADGSSVEPGSTAPPAAPAKPVSYPDPPAQAPPTGTWRVTLEFPRLQGQPAGIIADATGIYLAGGVLTADDMRSRRWAVAKLDPAAGAIAWSSVEELPRSPAPERIALAGGGLIVAGQDESHGGTRLLRIERREVESGKRTWQRSFTARDPKCTSTDCAGKDTFGGMAVHASSVLYSATVDKPIEEAFGELSLAKGAPTKSYESRSDLRAHDIAADDAGLYLVEDTLSNVVTLVKMTDGKTAWKQTITSNASRVAIAQPGVVLWGKTIEMRAADTGAVAWTSNLAGEHLDVAVDDSGVYATVMIDAKPGPYFAVAKLDASSGAVQWVRRTSEHDQHRPSTNIALDKDWLYLFGIDDGKWFVERRRKSDGALGDVPTTARTVESSAKKRR
ncbi:MAG TPA: hypothetical protein VLB44_03065 [Kofleriaceae bacterium]|nr:hypothetical protein [Kofleriaceae bacterium]